MTKLKRWLYPAILIVVTLTLSLLSFRRMRTRNQELDRVEKELSILLEEGYYREALSRIQGLSKLDRDYFSFQELTALVEIGNLTRAEAFMDQSQDLQKNKSATHMLFSGWKKKGDFDQAFLFLNKYKKAFENEFEPLFFDLLQERQIIPCQSSFYAGWFGDLAILQDNLGKYLVDALGQGVNYDRYEEIKSIQGGFMAKRKNYWALLDQKGHFTGLLTKEKKTQEEAGDYFFQRKESKGFWGFSYRGRVILPCEYEELSPLSPRGLAYGRREGRWYRIIFPALAQGREES